MISEYGNAIYEVEGERRKAELERLGFKEIVKSKVESKNKESILKNKKEKYQKAVKTNE